MPERIRLAVAVLLLAAGSAEAADLRIAAAGSMRPALEPMVADFHERHDDRVTVTYASSGSLRAQIANGAPFDLFLAADMDRPRSLHEAGIASAPEPYAHGRLALWHRSGGPPSLEALPEHTERLAIAHPDHAPYGARAVEALQSAGVREAMADRMVTGNTIGQAWQQARSGAADAALVSLSVVRQSEAVTEEAYRLVPRERHDPIVHGLTIPDTGGDPGAALERFLVYLGSAPGRERLRAHGLEPAGVTAGERAEE